MSPHHESDPVSALMRILGERWVLTLALRDGDDAPYPTPLFYALAEPGSLGPHASPVLLFASSASTHHGRLAGVGPTAASAAVYLETEELGILRGAQLRGVLLRDDALDPSAAQAARNIYVNRHRVAEPMLASGSHHLYALFVSWAKLTDNRLGFGAHPEVRFDPSCSPLAV